MEEVGETSGMDPYSTVDSLSGPWTVAWPVARLLTSPLLLCLALLAAAVNGLAVWALEGLGRSIVQVPTGILIVTVTSAYVGAYYRHGEERTVRGVILVSVRQLPRVLGVYVILAAVGGLIVLATIPIALLIWVFVALVLWGVVFAYLLVRTAFILPAVVIDRQPLTRALMGGWNLTTGLFWRVFGLFFLGLLLTAAVGLGLYGEAPAYLLLGVGAASGVSQVLVWTGIARLYVGRHFLPNPGGSSDEPVWKQHGRTVSQD